MCARHVDETLAARPRRRRAGGGGDQVGGFLESWLEAQAECYGPEFGAVGWDLED